MTDALWAIKTLVFEEHKYSLAFYKEALASTKQKLENLDANFVERNELIESIKEAKNTNAPLSKIEKLEKQSFDRTEDYIEFLKKDDILI